MAEINTHQIDPFDPEAPVFGAIEGGVGTVYLNRPAKRNAMTLAMWHGFVRVMDVLEAVPDVAVIVVRPRAGTAFCAGADISELEASISNPDAREDNRAALQVAQRRLADSNRPTIALIPGDCMGAGCGLAVHADLRLAAPTARFGITPIKLGLVYPLEDQARLVDLVGPARSKRILFTGRVFNADEALAMGLIDEVAKDENGLEALLAQYSEPMCARSRFSLFHIKQQFLAIEKGARGPSDASQALFRDAHDGDDAREGLGAFLEKRAPVFTWRPDMGRPGADIDGDQSEEA